MVNSKLRLDDLPLELLTEIGCWLPVFAIFSFRVTCKLFVKLDFRKMIPLHKGLLQNRDRYLQVLAKPEVLDTYFQYEPLSRHLYTVIYSTFSESLDDYLGFHENVTFHAKLIASFRFRGVIKFVDVRKALAHEEKVKKEKSNLVQTWKQIEHMRCLNEKKTGLFYPGLQNTEKDAKKMEKDLEILSRLRFTQYVPFQNGNSSSKAHKPTFSIL
jgi:hypothetical protein